MEKYTEAFCSIIGDKVSIMQMRIECNLDPAAYEKNYKGHLFCPLCKVVPLTVVHANGLLYYRGHPHEEHGIDALPPLTEWDSRSLQQKMVGGFSSQSR